MQNQPLSSGDQGKLLIFSLLMASSVILLVGVIPIIFLVFGIYMMKKNQDFSNIDTAVKSFKGYMWLVLIGCAIVSFYQFDYEYAEDFLYNDDFLTPFICSIIACVYLIAVQLLFYKPLKKHSEWVAVNGILSTKPKQSKEAGASSEMDIIKGENLKQYSVADELIKWAKLKEDGHISEDEFNEARSKLLSRN